MAKFDRKALMQVLPLGLAVAAMLLACYVQGVYSERWGKFAVLKRFSEQLTGVPAEFGNWTSIDLPSTSEELLKAAGAEGEVVRLYRKKDNEHQAVQVSLICARMQDCFYHTPERCYTFAGFVMDGKELKTVVPIPEHGEAEFKTAVFTKPSATGSNSQRGYWSFCGDGVWVTPDYKKIRFLGQHQAIYKLYVFSNVDGKQVKEKAGTDLCQEFIKDFLPVLDAHLRPALVDTGRVKDTPADAPAATPAAQSQAMAR